MGAGKILMIIGALLTLLGTYVFAIYGGVGIVGSGIGFILNTADLFTDAATYAALLSIDVIIFYLLVVVFLIFLASGVLQLLGMKNRIVGLLFSLFPLGVGLMFVALAYTDFLGIKSAFFALFFIGEQFGNIYPILLELGDLALGAYLILGGGVLGVVATFLPRD
jgi:hypothetical protein